MKPYASVRTSLTMIQRLNIFQSPPFLIGSSGGRDMKRETSREWTTCIAVELLHVSSLTARFFRAISLDKTSLRPRLDVTKPTSALVLVPRDSYPAPTTHRPARGDDSLELGTRFLCAPVRIPIFLDGGTRSRAACSKKR